MVVAYASCFFFDSLSVVTLTRPLANDNNARRLGTTSAKRTDESAATSTRRGNQLKIPSLRVPNPFLARSVVSVLGLGFVDAGYSGDWSRIGAITKETEDLLKIAAFLVVPFCMFLIFSFSKETESD